MIRLPLLPKAPPEGVEVHYNCARCMAICCQSVSTEIDPPTTPRDYDNLRWYLMHPGVRVYVDEYSCWFVQYESPCRYLGEDNLCQIYDSRPQICHDLQPTECEFARGPGDRVYFTCLEEFDHWFEERERRRRARADKRQAEGRAARVRPHATGARPRRRAARS
ncbi:MAG: YkgJ family cysteine cluster protein [Candidatus Krumholzibacteriia bacterium]